MGNEMVKGNDDGAYFVLIFGVLGILAFSVQMIPNASYLKINENGFECKTLFRSEFVKWEDVEIFFPTTISRKTMVAWRYKEKPKAKSHFRISNADSALPENYGLYVDELAELLNKERTKYATAKKHNK